MNAVKKRLDLLVVEKGLAPTRQKARALIMAAQVLVDGQPVTKPGWAVGDDAAISAKAAPHPYVSRGGLKLSAALQDFHLDVRGKTCLDVGASTGGFTDCLLRHGALRVYAVDVGYGQLAWSLRQDERVRVIERTNIRTIDAGTIPEPVAAVFIDVSFISLRLVVPAVLAFMQPQAFILALIKPQFEVGKGQVGKGGVVRDARLHEEVLAGLSSHFTQMGLHCSAAIPSAILGPKGNREFFMRMSPAGIPHSPRQDGVPEKT